MDKKLPLIIITIIVVFALACSATFTVGYPTPTIEPPTAIATSTKTISLSEQVTLSSVPYREEDPGGDFPPYMITSQTPQIIDRDDPHVMAFNQHVNTFVTQGVDEFRQSFRQLNILPVSSKSTLDVSYMLISQTGDIWSLKFDFSFYSHGAAHPGLTMKTLNYDLETDQEITLESLFIANSNYLETISNYCISELRKQPFSDSFTTSGADPTLENYRNWNIAPEGLMITFDAYQVAPGAAGPQVILIPYAQIQEAIAPQGPLRELLR